MSSLFSIILRYISSIEDIDKARPEHVKFLDEYYAKGVFLISGAQTPRTGGVIIARHKSRKELEAIMHQDPFYTLGLAEYQVFEFKPTKSSPIFNDFLS